MAYVDKINVQGTNYDIQDKRLPEVGGVVTLNDEFTANEIIEKMNGYAAALSSQTGWTYEKVYCGVCKNGNKLTFVLCINLTKTDGDVSNDLTLCNFSVPSSVGAKLYPVSIGGYNFLAYDRVVAFASVTDSTLNKNCDQFWRKGDATNVNCGISFRETPVVDTTYFVRLEATFLLSDDLIPQE